MRCSSVRGLVVGVVFFFFQAEDGIRDYKVTGVQTCALPISDRRDQVVEVVGLHDRGLPALVEEPAGLVAGAGAGDEHERSGERRVGEEGRSRGAADHLKKKKKGTRARGAGTERSKRMTKSEG